MAKAGTDHLRTPATGSGSAPAARDPVPEALAARLLHARTARAVAEILFANAADLRRQGARLWWWDHWLGPPEHYPETALAPDALEQAREALARIRDGSRMPGFVMVTDHGDAAAVLHCPGEPPAAGLLAPIGERMGEVLAMERLHATVARLGQSEKLQRSLYAIADLAGSSMDMPDMLRSLHRVVSGLMYAENFYIVRYDRERETTRFLYFVDAAETNPPPDREIPMTQLEHGLTWYVLRDAKPLMGSYEEIQRQASGPIRFRGKDSSNWLGVPMLRNGEVHGAMVVQTYLAEVRYTGAEMALLSFVAEHVLTALERKEQRGALERRVRDRTAELARTNEELRREVAERERGERLQSALYRIAELSGGDDSTESFFRQVHAIVAELINARNFYVALLSDDGTTLSFPYSVDEHDPPRPDRAVGRGLTEYVIRTGQPQVIDDQREAILGAAGEITSISGARSRVWMGSPLLDGETTIGAIAVQSYSPEVHYGEREAELLRFAAYQVASSIQRRRAAERLRQANAELEQRVEERTRELRAEIGVRQQVEARLQHQVMHDPLTDLPNRVYMRGRIERALAGIRRDPGYRFGVLYIDVDRFKQINDSLGHLAGDLVLQEVAARLSAAVREPDAVARLSGDEFAILLERVQEPDAATRVAERVLQAMQQPIEVAGQALKVGVSIGLAIGGAEHGGIDDVVRDADAALYRAKSSGRNRLVLYDQALDREATDDVALEADLRRALAADEFVPYFQPVVRLSDGSTTGYEALLRWRHPERGLLLPRQFMAAAEDSGLIEEIDWLGYRKALAQARTLLIDGAFLAINLSAHLFRDAKLDERLLALLAESGMDPARLRIEVTERALLAEGDAVQAVLARLRAACVETALDDFGTGHASLGQMHRFPLRTIKIDRSFVEAVDADGGGKAMVAAILALARALGLDVVAEGVETERQRQALLALGCSHGQGYLFGKPQPADRWLQHRP